MNIEANTLKNYIDSLPAKGRYTFTGSEALTALKITPIAFKLAALRLIKKNKLIRVKHGFYVIVPTEYQKIGAPPVAWFIDYLMKFNQQPYYVGLLSAAALHGAAHQQPQIFQIITDKPIRPIHIGRIHIEFFTKKYISANDYQLIKTPTGYMQVSTPEITALDLIRYAKSVGHLNHVATILTELQEKFDVKRLSNILESENVDTLCVQRLGYLLDVVKANNKFTDLLKRWIKKQQPRLIPLRSDKPYKQSKENNDWFLYINEKIESDL